MIISRTPLRISFFGGGTDYPVWYDRHPGAVLATSINKYTYISCRPLPPYFEHKSQIVWSKLERVKDHSEIQHPAVREALRFMHIDHGVEIHHDGDLPARAGLGSSSSFTVGLLHVLNAMKGIMAPKLRLAEEAIHVEQELIRENVGSQDQVTAAFGGFNRISFSPGHRIEVAPIICSPQRVEELESHLMLVFTGFSRTASDVAKEQIATTPHNHKTLQKMLEMVDAAVGIICSGTSIVEFGRLLHEGWQLKRRLSSQISNSVIDEIYQVALEAGAVGGKLLGAGGGGFMMFLVPPERQPRVREKLNTFLHVPFRFETRGSQIIFFDPNSGMETAAERRSASV